MLITMNGRRCRFAILQICIAVSLMIPAGCSQKIDTPLEFVEVARHHERQEEWPEAVAAYRSAVKLDDSDAQTWYDLGVALEALQQFSQSIEAYTQAIERDRSFGQAYNNRAAAHARLQQFEQAIADFDQAIALSPGDALAWRNRGLARHDTGDLTAALQDFDESLRLNSNDLTIFLLRGNLLMELGEYEQALADLKICTDRDPAFDRAWVSRAKAEAALNDGAAAERSLAQARKLGADVDDVSEIAFAPVESAVPPPASAGASSADDLREYLTAAGFEAQPAAAPWDFHDEASDTWFVVRVANAGVVQFTDHELQRLQQYPDRHPTLLIVDPTADGAARIRSVASWDPGRTDLRPTVWSWSVKASAQSLTNGSPAASDESPSSAEVAETTNTRSEAATERALESPGGD